MRFGAHLSIRGVLKNGEPTEPGSAAVPAASCSGVSPPARTPGGTPDELAGEDACATSAGQFMVPMHGKIGARAFHEPRFGVQALVGRDLGGYELQAFFRRLSGPNQFQDC